MEVAQEPECPVCLPSSTSAYKFVTQQEGSAGLLALHWLGRSLIVTAGLYCAGLRKDQLLKASLFSGAAIELSLICWAIVESRKRAPIV